jgi:TetR/AcrR family transcriptional repressor of nem operon
MARVREFDTEAAVEAALATFRLKGYEGTSVQDLVDATGVGRGSLYAAFGNKEGLYLAAMDRYREQYAVPLVELLRGGAPARAVIREVLVSVVDDIVADGSRHACLIVGAATERAAHDPEIARKVRDITASLEDALTELIAHAQSQGEIASERDARALARFFVMTTHVLRVTGAVMPERAALMSAVEVALDALG